MPTDPSFSTFTLRTIRIRLDAEAGRHNDETRQALVLSALAAALIVANDSASTAWTVQPVRAGEPLLYDLIPLSDHPVSFKAAREMTTALMDQPQIAAAEPTFATPPTDGRDQNSSDAP